MTRGAKLLLNGCMRFGSEGIGRVETIKIDVLHCFTNGHLQFSSTN